MLSFFISGGKNREPFRCRCETSLFNVAFLCVPEAPNGQMSRTASCKAPQGDSVASAPTPLAPGPTGGPPFLSNSTRNYSINICGPTFPAVTEVNIVHGHLSSRCSKITDFSSETPSKFPATLAASNTTTLCSFYLLNTFQNNGVRDPSTSNGGKSTQNLTLLLMLVMVLAATLQKQARALERSPEVGMRLDLGDRNQVADCQKPRFV